jgi:hypothetical protein
MNLRDKDNLFQYIFPIAAIAFKNGTLGTSLDFLPDPSLPSRNFLVFSHSDITALNYGVAF